MTPPNTDHTDSDMNVSIKSDTDPLEAIDTKQLLISIVEQYSYKDSDVIADELLKLIQQEKKEAERLALKEPNDLLRSCFQVACREYALDGENTNWSPLIDRLRDELARQHQIMHPNTEQEQS